MKSATPRHFSQQGVVLFVALIALVVMSLAAVALIRSVDTNTIIAGNMALKHSALVSSDRGVETAVNWLDAQVYKDLENNKSDEGYYATYKAPELDKADILRSDATWQNAAVAQGSGIVSGTEEGTGNKIRFIIQRMCDELGEIKKENCLIPTISAGNNSNAVVDITKAGGEPKSDDNALFRITTRVEGAKNTFSYTQTYVY